MIMLETEVENQSDYPIATYMRVFHDRQYAFPARAAAEPVEEIRQPVLMQAAGYQQSGNHGA